MTNAATKSEDPFSWSRILLHVSAVLHVVCSTLLQDETVELVHPTVLQLSGSVIALSCSAASQYLFLPQELPHQGVG